MHEYSGACVCFQCHDKLRSHEMAALQARCNSLELSCKEWQQENARLQKLVDMNQKLIDAVRKHCPVIQLREDQPIGKALRELDGEKK